MLLIDVNGILSARRNFSVWKRNMESIAMIWMVGFMQKGNGLLPESEDGKYAFIIPSLRAYMIHA